MSGTSAGRFQILIGTISRPFAAQLVSSYHISVLKLAGGKLPVSGQSMQEAQFEIRLLMCSALILITGNIIVPSLCIYDDCLLSGLWMHALVVKSFSQNLKIRGFVFPNACQAWIRSSSPWCKSAWKHTHSLGRPFRSWDICLGWCLPDGKLFPEQDHLLGGSCWTCSTQQTTCRRGSCWTCSTW